MKINVLFIGFFVIVLGGCTRQIEIPEGKFGVLLHLGEVESFVSGPGVIEKRMYLDTIVLIDKKSEIILNQGMYRLKYEVTDPVMYYKKFRSDSDRLRVLVENKISNNNSTKKNNISELIHDMKLPLAVRLFCAMPC